MDVNDVVRECFPEVSDGLLKMAAARAGSDVPVSKMGVEDPVMVLEAVGKDRKAIASFSKMMGCERGLAMEYMGPFGDVPGFCERPRTDVRPRFNIVVLTDMEGNPNGMIPFGCDLENEAYIYSELRGYGRIIVTDRVPYSRENRMALDRSKEEYLLIEPDFPASYGSTQNAKMQDLKHDGKTLSACKIRFDKQWLFRFTDHEKAERVRRWIETSDISERNRGYIELTAGTTDIVSNSGMDVREALRLKEVREALDSKMDRHRRLLAQEIGVVDSEPAVMGYLFMSVLSMMIS